MLRALGKFLALLVFLLVCAVVYLYVVSPHTGYRLAQSAERARAGLQVKQVQVGEFNIKYLIGGSGPPLLMVHGFGADKDNWVRVAADLTGQYHVIAPDLPGFGESSRPANTDYRATTQARRLHDFVLALGLKKVNIAGNSMGGAIAGAYAAAYPEQTLSLWLLDPADVASAPRSALFKQLAAGGANPLLPQTHEQYYDLLNNWVFVHEPYIPAPIKYVLAEKAVKNRPLLKNIFQQLVTEKLVLEKALAGSPVPTLVMWGKQDRLLSPAGAQILANAIPNAKVVLLDDTGHTPMIERPHESAAAFKAFTKNLPTRAGQPAAASQ